MPKKSQLPTRAGMAAAPMSTSGLFTWKGILQLKAHKRGDCVEWKCEIIQMKLCNLRTSLRNRVGRKPWVGAITKPWRSFKFSSWTNIIRRVNCQSGFQMGGNQNLFLLIEVIDKVIIGIFLSRWQIGRSTVHARILILTSTTQGWAGKAFWLPGTGREIENHIPVLREGNGN